MFRALCSMLCGLWPWPFHAMIWMSTLVIEHTLPPIWTWGSRCKMRYGKAALLGVFLEYLKQRPLLFRGRGMCDK